MKAHVIENGVVVNTIVVESLDVLPNLVDAEIGGAIGNHYVNGAFVIPPRPESDIASEVRAERDTLLTKSDVNVLPDRWAAMTPEKQAEWSTYRQALRDIPQQAGFTQNVVWPVKPV